MNTVKIGLTTFIDKKSCRDYMSLGYSYVNSVIAGGALPIILPVTTDEKLLDEYLNQIDGVIITGGADVDPSCYDEDPVKQLGTLEIERDLFELALIKKAMERKIPLFGICRGSQIINVSLGGSLYQDIYSQLDNINGHNPSVPRSILYHEVNVEKDSMLYEIMKEEKIRVNSFHHQAIKYLGKGLRATAFANDKIIECIEYSGESFVMGVQWHPEDLSVKYEQFLNIFKFFINKCGK